MKISTLVVMFVVVPAALAGRPGCNIPLSKTDEGFKFSASSSTNGREASNAKLDATRGWCAKSEIIYREYLQVDLSSPRHIAAIQTKGFEYSYRNFYVKQFFVGYSMDGKKWKFYKSKSNGKSKSGKRTHWTQKFVGNSDTSNLRWNEFHPSFLAKYVRIYPLTFRGGLCTKVEFFGCNKTIDCTHVLKLNENQRLNITSPSYPLPPARGLRCNWLIHLPKPNTQVSLASLDFDIGGSNSSVNSTLCEKNVVGLYKGLYSFSAYLVGTYCQRTNHTLPRVSKISSEFLRIVFDVGDDAVKSHRGFNFIVWETQKDIKTAEGCENSTISLDCRGHERSIQVTDVFYGQRQYSDICTLNGTKAASSKPKASCRVQGVLPKLQSSCDYRNVCMVTIERKTFPHDCTASGAMEMFIVYQCNATERVVVTSSLPSVVSTYKPTTASQQIPATVDATTHNGVVTTTPPPSTPPPTPPPTTIPSTSAPAVMSKLTTVPVEEVLTYHTREVHASKSENTFTSSVILIAVSAGVGFLLIVIIVVTCICLKKSRKGDEKAEVSKKDVVSLESLQKKEMVGSDNSLYEKIDDLEREVDNVRYETNKYSPLHGMSENPLYQRAESNNSYPSYDVPIAIGTKGLNVGTGDNALNISASPSESNYMANFKSPDELPSNSIPMARYLEPPKSPSAFTSIIMPLDRNSESLGTPVTSSSAEEVYETMGGSLA